MKKSMNLQKQYTDLLEDYESLCEKCERLQADHSLKNGDSDIVNGGKCYILLLIRVYKIMF